MKKIPFAIGLLLLLCSWGYLIHRTTLQLAVYQLPRKLQPFFYQNIEYLVKNSIRPDERRRTDTTEAPKHFIDLEAYGDSAAWKIPETWEAAKAKYPVDTLREYGTVPWVIMDQYRHLTTAFRQKNRDSILFYAADLAHYIGDAHVPLHTSINYDGQLTNQKGLHSLWESTVPELSLDTYQLYAKHKAQYIRNPQHEAWEMVRNTSRLVQGVFDEERAASNGFTDATKFRVQQRNGVAVKSFSTAFAQAYGQRLNASIQEQLRRTAQKAADFWYTAWVDAGKPDLSGLMKPRLEAQADSSRIKLKAELKAYKQNDLLKKGWLMARRPDITQ